MENADLLKKYFWDTDFDGLDPVKHKKYVLERILEMGDEKTARWALDNFSREDLMKVVRTSRQLSPKSRNFWDLILQR